MCVKTHVASYPSCHTDDNDKDTSVPVATDDAPLSSSPDPTAAAAGVDAVDAVTTLADAVMGFSGAQSDMDDFST